MHLTSRSSIVAVTIAQLLITAGVHAADATWNQTAGGTTYDWNTNANWTAAFPNGNGEIASVNNNIAGAQTIRLQQAISIGTLNLGDSDGSHVFTISTGTGTNVLTLQSATPGGATSLNVGGSLAVVNVISTGVTLGGTSDLTLNFGGTQGLNLTGTLDMNGNTLTITGTGGALGIGSSATNGGITGTGTIIKNNTGTMNANSGLTNYSGDLIVNAGSVSIVNGQLNTVNATINGFFTPSGSAAVQNGGTVVVGSGSSFATAPNNRLPANLTLNGGHLNAGGQPLTNANDTVTDSLTSLTINSSYSIMTVGRGGDDNHIVNVTTLSRGAGATIGVRAADFGTKAQLFVSNINTGNGGGSFLTGGGGAAGSTTMSIIPWMMAANTNASAGNPSDWGTYVAGEGIRSLVVAEYAVPADTAALLALPSTSNVKSNSGLGNGQTKTVNSLIRTSAGVTNIGSGSTLTLASGGLSLGLNGAGMGVAGDVNAGTLDFGTAEGVTWAFASNVNTIGSVISGSGGLTKAGIGTLVLQGTNTYTGRTYVSGGTLQVGDGTFDSNLGVTGDVAVAIGALLKLLNDNAIADNAVLTLEKMGLYNGKIDLAAGINESVGGLFLGNTSQAAGTYGSTSSAADFQSDVWFSGSGIITVVPEPATLVLIGIGTMLIVGRRRGSV